MSKLQRLIRHDNTTTIARIREFCKDQRRRHRRVTAELIQRELQAIVKEEGGLVDPRTTIQLSRRIQHGGFGMYTTADLDDLVDAIHPRPLRVWAFLCLLIAGLLAALLLISAVIGVGGAVTRTVRHTLLEGGNE